MRAHVTPAEVTGFQARTLQEALASAWPVFWERRALDFENARPRTGDYNGRATCAEVTDRDKRCRQAAENCRRHARVLRDREIVGVSREVVSVFQEVA